MPEYLREKQIMLLETRVAQHRSQVKKLTVHLHALEDKIEVHKRIWLQCQSEWEMLMKDEMLAGNVPQPSSESDRTWHVCDVTDPEGYWDWGVDCERCRGSKTGNLYADTNPYLAIETLKRQNREGITTAGEVREVLSDVKPEDREKITRAH